MNTGHRITEIRSSQGMSLTNLAKRSGIAQSSLSYIESGKARPTIETLEKICTALGVELHEFFAPAGQAPELPPDIRRIIDLAKQLTPRQREILLAAAEEWAGVNKEKR